MQTPSKHTVKVQPLSKADELSLAPTAAAHPVWAVMVTDASLFTTVLHTLPLEKVPEEHHLSWGGEEGKNGL